MRILMFTLLTLFCGVNSYCQNLQNQSMVLDFLGEERFESFEQNNPNHLIYLDVKFSVGYSMEDAVQTKMNDKKYITDITYKKADGVDYELSVEEIVQMYQDGTLNFLRMKLPYDQHKDTYYILGKTGKILILHSANSIVSATNQITQNQ